MKQYPQQHNKNIPPTHPTNTTPHKKKLSVSNKKTLQSTVQPPFVPKYSQIDYQTNISNKKTSVEQNKIY